jgi:hypothetical protein
MWTRSKVLVANGRFLRGILYTGHLLLSVVYEVIKVRRLVSTRLLTPAQDGARDGSLQGLKDKDSASSLFSVSLFTDVCMVSLEE